MTTSELKQQIEKVLGNSIRCLLPSYWWKRLFHQVADRIDEVEKKVDDIVIPTPTSASSVFFIAPLTEGGELSAESKSKNAASYRKVVNGFAKNEFYDVKVHYVFVVIDADVISNPVFTDSVLKLMYKYNSATLILSVSADGSATIEDVGTSASGATSLQEHQDISHLATKEKLNNAVETITNTIIENEEITAAALNELNERVVTPYEYYKEKGGVVSESAYNIMTKYLFTPFIISTNSTTTIPDELLNESQNSFFTDYYWNFMRLTGGEPIRTTQWADNIPQKFVGISSGLSFVIDFSNKTITPEQ